MITERSRAYGTEHMPLHRYLFHEGLHAASAPYVAVGGVGNDSYNSMYNVAQDNFSEYMNQPGEIMSHLGEFNNELRRDAAAGKIDESYGDIVKALNNPRALRALYEEYFPSTESNNAKIEAGANPRHNGYMDIYGPRLSDPNFINFATQVP